MMPRQLFLSVQRWFALCLLALSLSAVGPAQAQESEPQILNRVYCDNIELDNPDLERCEVFLEELAAEEELLNQMISESRLIASERRDEAPEHSENSLATRATDPTTGERVLRASVGAVTGGIAGFALGGIVGFLGCELVDGGNGTFGCDLSGIGGAMLGGIIGLPIGATKGWGRSKNSDRQVSIAPYRQDDASGLMFSGQF